MFEELQEPRTSHQTSLFNGTIATYAKSRNLSSRRDFAQVANVPLKKDADE